ncbi:MAG: hypothetical protein Q8876_07230 [Bacillota bacterium]|nr:hypothetical protein [Bacillota bacterium]
MTELIMSSSMSMCKGIFSSKKIEKDSQEKNKNESNENAEKKDNK